jgi:aldehyde:ferredoxin oxidoreductase
MKGYNGKILRVNLSTRQVSTEEPAEEYYKTYLGGRGFIVHTLLKEVPRGADPLGPENKLVFALGPITGHPFPGSGRNSVGAKSPLSGGFGESEAGGFWGAELKRSGYDAIIVEGKSDQPVYLWIKDGRPEIRDARNLWGLDVAETERVIQKELQDDRVRTAVIGPAGEKLVRFASICNDISHVAGRTGMGAVMGSKKLKAVAVRGDAPPEMGNREKVLELSRWMGKNFKTKTNFWQYGTGQAMDYYEASGNLPIRNFAGGRFPQVEGITSQSMYKKGYVERMDSCYGCPVRCKKKVKLDQPWKVDPVYGGPEYETLGAFGSNCGVGQVEAIMKANELCCRYGLDTISAGVTISFAMECFEKGVLTLKDTDGLELTFGNAPAMVEMVERIALRRGLGNLLAEGTKRAAEAIGKGSAEWAMQVKGEEIPMHEPRYKQGMGLHYSVHATGADHCSGTHDDVVNKKLAEWDRIGLAESVPVYEMSGRKARMLYQVGMWRHLPNHIGLCVFVPWSNEQVIQALEAITGWPVGSYKLMKTVERGMTLARIFNLREGFSQRDDTLPRRFASSPADSPLKGLGVDPEKLSAAQKLYYQMLGWDESGVPTYARLVELNIEWAAQYLPAGQ